MRRTDPRPGTVYLVGAGPGDPGLITVRGLQLLRRAEVLVYDRLVGPELIAEAPPTAERVDVGKAPGKHGTPQEAIHALLVEQARRGRVVVRLKGGDPFVFGRGAEEAEALAKAGVPFQVVPGITSAVAVPACAGIPVTDRRYASSFRVIAGHGAREEEGSSSSPRRETVVVLMPMGALAQVVQRLRRDGWRDDAPLAFVEQGTTPHQRTITTTLGEAVAVADRERVRPPAVVVVGDVVRLRDRFTRTGQGVRQVRASPQARTSHLAG